MTIDVCHPCLSPARTQLRGDTLPTNKRKRKPQQCPRSESAFSHYSKWTSRLLSEPFSAIFFIPCTRGSVVRTEGSALPFTSAGDAAFRDGAFPRSRSITRASSAPPPNGCACTPYPFADARGSAARRQAPVGQDSHACRVTAADAATLSSPLWHSFSFFFPVLAKVLGACSGGGSRTRVPRERSRSPRAVFVSTGEAPYRSTHRLFPPSFRRARGFRESQHNMATRRNRKCAAATPSIEKALLFPTGAPSFLCVFCLCCLRYAATATILLPTAPGRDPL